MDGKERNNIRGIKNCSWYWIDRSVLKRYGRIMKPSGIAVYNALASYANSKSQSCFPTQQTIAGQIGFSRETVNRKIRLLSRIGLIGVKRIRRHCLYFLLKPDVILNHTICDRSVTGYVTLNHTNKNKEIELIKKNYGADGFNDLKPLRRLLKEYDKRFSKNSRD